MRVLFRRLVAFVAAVLNFLRQKIHLRRQPEVEPEPEKDPDEEAMTDEKMRDAWHNAQLGDVLVENNIAVVVRTMSGCLEIPKAPPTELEASGRWFIKLASD